MIGSAIVLMYADARETLRLNSVFAIDTEEHALLLDCCGNVWNAVLSSQQNVEREKENVNPWEIIDLACIGTKTVCSLSVSEGSIYVLTEEGDLWVMGSNVHGELGIGSFVNQSNLVAVPLNVSVVQVVASGFMAAILDSNGGVWTCGMSALGKMGQRSVPLPERFTRIRIKAETAIQKIALGVSDHILLDTSGCTWFCGSTDCTGDAESHFTPWRIYICDRKIVDISCGDHALFLDEDGIVWGTKYGTNELDSSLRVSDLVDQHLEVYNLTSQYNLPKVIAITAGYGSNFVIDEHYSVHSHGDNEYGKLGIGRSEDFIDRFQIVEGLPPIIEVICDWDRTYFVSAVSTIWASGLQWFAQSHNSTPVEFTDWPRTKIPSKAQQIKSARN